MAKYLRNHMHRANLRSIFIYGELSIKKVFLIVCSLTVYLILILACSHQKLGANSGPALSGRGTIKPDRQVNLPNSALGASRKNLPPGMLYIPPELEKALGARGADYMFHKLPDGSSLDIAIEPGVREVISSQSRISLLNLYFVLDVTGSMEKNIDAIKSNVSDLVSKLKNSGLTPKIGLIAFRDTIVEQLPPTNNIDKFMSVVDRQNAQDGGDAWEASLLGIQRAALDLEQNYTPGDSNAILVISDNPGHLGDSTDCSIDRLTELLNSFPIDFQKSLHIYGSVRADLIGADHKTCGHSSGSRLAKDQFEDILNSSLLAVDLSKRGGVLDYPLSSEVILGDLFRVIERTVEGQRNVCLTKSFSIFDGPNNLNSWSGLSLSESYGTFVLGQPLIWKNALNSAVAQNVRGKHLRAQVDRCCISENLALLGNFSSCNTKTFEFGFVIDR